MPKKAVKEALVEAEAAVDVLIGEVIMHFDSDLPSTQEVEVLPDVDGDLIRLKYLSVDYNDRHAVLDYKVKCIYRSNEVVVASFDQRETPICHVFRTDPFGEFTCNYVEVDVDELFGDLLCEKLVLSATGIRYQPGEARPPVWGIVVFKYSGSVVRLG